MTPPDTQSRQPASLTVFAPFASGMQSDWACLLANTSSGRPHHNKSLIVVPMDARGITKSTITKMGMHVRHTCKGT